MIPRMRRPGLAPRGRAFPVLSLWMSALAHATVLAALWALGGLWSQSSKVYVVNLVPSVSAIGSPQSRPARPASEPVAKELPPPALPQLPRSDALPSSRPVALPRPGEKEQAPLTSGKERPPVVPPALPRAEPTPHRAEPASLLRPPATSVAAGQPSGSPQGTAALSLDVSDFPHAWYLRQILQKVEDSWTRQAKVAEPEHKPLVYVEIQRDGSIRPPRIEKSSGNVFYDQAALRAIVEASPFPPLPLEWPKPSLRVLFRFELRVGRG